MRVAQISLIDVLKKYANYNETEIEKQGKNVYLTRCPIHKEKNGTSFAIYDKGTHWDWCCFGTCDTGGQAPHLLVVLGITDTIEKAVERLETDFGISLPDTVTLDNFCEIKGFTKEFLQNRGITEVTGGIEIPYYNENKEIIAIKKRVKYKGGGKYFFVTGSNTLYGLDKLSEYDGSVLYLTEGETDALTLMQAGLPVLGIPGAKAWRQEWISKISFFEKIILVPDPDTAGKNLVDTLRSSIENLYIIKIPTSYKDLSDYFLYGNNRDVNTFYSNFTKLTPIPATKNALITTLSANPSLVADSQIWTVVLSNITQAQRELLIEEVSAATGIKKKIIAAAIKEALATIVENINSDIFQKDGAYYKYDIIQGIPVERKITNYVMKLVYTIENQDKTHDRYIKLISETGQEAGPVPFNGEELTSVPKFAAYCMSFGPFSFYGNQRDLIDLVEFVQKQNPDFTVYAVRNIGKVGSKWILGNIGVDENGIVVKENEQGFIEFHDKRFVVRSLNINDDTEETGVSAIFPTFPEPPGEYDIEKIADEFLHAIQKNLGSYAPWLGLGWCVSNWYSDAIYKHRGDMSYPIFFINGKRASGKTYLARWLMSLAGFPYMEGKNFASPTIVSMTRKLGYYASLPLWYDDYREDIRDINQRTEFLLGVYNRQGADKGIKGSFGIRSEAIKGTLLLSGEDMPRDSALYSRLVLIHTSQYTRQDEYLPKVQELTPYLPILGLMFCKKSQIEGSAAVLDALDKYQKKLMETGIDGRIAKNYAVCLAGLEIGFGKYITEAEWDEFMSWLHNHLQHEHEVKEETHVTNQFLTDLSQLILTNRIERGMHYTVDGEHLCIWYTPVYNEWVRYIGELRRSAVNKQTLKDYIQKEPYYKGEARQYLGKSGRQRCMVIDLKTAGHEELLELCNTKEEF